MRRIAVTTQQAHGFNAPIKTLPILPAAYARIALCLFELLNILRQQVLLSMQKKVLAVAEHNADSRASGRALSREQSVAFQRVTQLAARGLHALSKKA